MVNIFGCKTLGSFGFSIFLTFCILMMSMNYFSNPKKYNYVKSFTFGWLSIQHPNLQAIINPVYNLI